MGARESNNSLFLHFDSLNAPAFLLLLLYCAYITNGEQEKKTERTVWVSEWKRATSRMTAQNRQTCLCERDDSALTRQVSLFCSFDLSMCPAHWSIHSTTSRIILVWIEIILSPNNLNFLFIRKNIHLIICHLFYRSIFSKMDFSILLSWADEKWKEIFQIFKI